MAMRSEIQFWPATRPGNGDSRRWTRVIQGKRYSFTAVTMPDGERRYFASRLDGPDWRFDCNWTHGLIRWVFKP